MQLLTSFSHPKTLMPIEIYDFAELQDYTTTWSAMRDYTLTRTEQSADQIWLLEHTPVFTQGQAGKPEHLLFQGDIPLVQSDRGGQITYHGPGQLVAYCLLDLKRLQAGPRQLVCCLEQAIIALLAGYQITALANPHAPGVYVDQAKIASIGLRIKRGCSYHGLSLNIALPLAPFRQINPCGFTTLTMTQLSALSNVTTVAEIKARLGYLLADEIMTKLGSLQKPAC